MTGQLSFQRNLILGRTWISCSCANLWLRMPQDGCQAGGKAWPSSCISVQLRSCMKQVTLSPIYILHFIVNIHHVMNYWNQSIVSWYAFVKPPLKYIAVHARLLAVSSSLVPGCSIRDDGANFPQEQFEQILQPLAKIERYLIVSKLLTKESHKTQCDSLLFLRSLYKLGNRVPLYRNHQQYLQRTNTVS